MYPYGNPGFLSRGLRLTRGINWGSLLDGTQKTLGVINQAIPIVYQVKPIINNAKTMLRIASQMASTDSPRSNISNNPINQNTQSIQTIQNNNLPIFYI